MQNITKSYCTVLQQYMDQVQPAHKSHVSHVISIQENQLTIHAYQIARLCWAKVAIGWISQNFDCDMLCNGYYAMLARCGQVGQAILPPPPWIFFPANTYVFKIKCLKVQVYLQAKSHPKQIVQGVGIFHRDFRNM